MLKVVEKRDEREAAEELSLSDDGTRQSTRRMVCLNITVFRMCNAIEGGLIAALVFMLSATAQAATITVDSLVDTGAPGICVLRDAITAANTMTAANGCAAGDGNDTVQFSVTGTISLASTLPQITDGKLTINGPASPGITIDGGGAVRVMVVASNATVNLKKLKIIHGFADSDGGGIDNDGTLNVANSTFSGNRARLWGGGIGNEGRLTVSNSTFANNIAINDPGGGIYTFDGKVTITNSTFSGNSALWGGGILNAGGSLTITNSTFSGNSSSTIGGGIISFDGTMTITNSTFSGNSSGGRGGGISNDSGSLTITNSTFSGNSAGSGGGGGGISNGGTLTVTNSTFSGNSTSRGPVTISNTRGTLTVTNSTIRGAVTNNLSVGHGTLTLKSTILAGGGHKCAGTITDAGYNISDDSSCGFSAIGSSNNTDPQLDPAGLRNNGGRTRTIALQPSSPAIDAIPLADCTDQASPPNQIHRDQRGFPRPDNGESACDIGAYEFQDAP